jgi:hypothetical protein
MDAFARIAKNIHTSRGYGAGGHHADEMMEQDARGRRRVEIEPYRRWKWLAVIVAIVLVAAFINACTTTPNPGPCPPVKEYDAEFTAEFRKQLDTIPAGSPVDIYLRDAKELRDKVRKCQ